MIDPALPASADAERAVLGAILLNREAIVAVADTLKPDHFYLEKHAQIYAAARDLYLAKTPPDIRTVTEELRRRNQLDAVGGIPYLADLDVPTSAHVSYYTIDVLRAATRRRLIAAVGRIAALAYTETEDVATMLAQAHDLIDGASIALHDPRYTPFTADDLDDEVLPDLTWAIPNLLPQGLTMLIGKPKMRKSWLALSIALAVATGGRALGSIPVQQGDVLYLALEDSKRRLQSRQRKILQGSGAPRRLSYLTSAPRIDEGCVSTIESWLRRHPEARLVIVDVLAKVRPRGKGGNMYDEDYAALEPLQQLAIRRDIAILVVHHMNRSDAEDIYDLVNGSNGVGGCVDGLMALVYERGQTDATLKIGSRELEDESALALRWDGTTAQWILLGKAEEVKVSNERAEIVRLLREERRPMAPREVADALMKDGREYQNLKQLMYRMAREGDLANSGGRYTVPSLTLLATDDGGDPVIDGDLGAITENRIRRSDAEASNGRSNGHGDPSDRTPDTKNLDHRDHRITMKPPEASEGDRAGDRTAITVDHRMFDEAELAVAPTQSPEIDWPYVRACHAAGDLAKIRVHCAMRGQDYDRILRLLTPEAW